MQSDPEISGPRIWMVSLNYGDLRGSSQTGKWWLRDVRERRKGVKSDVDALKFDGEALKGTADALNNDREALNGNEKVVKGDEE